MQKITVSRALVELKRFDERINQAIKSGVYSVIMENGKPLNNVLNSTKEARGKIQGSLDKVEELISNRNKIKSAVTYANATTKVVFLGKEMTVSDVIEHKSSVRFKEDYLREIVKQKRSSEGLIEKRTSDLEKVLNSLASEAIKTEKGLDATTQSYIDSRREKETPTMLDGEKLEKVIEALEKEIELINTELDYVLSEVNAKTEIEVNI